MLGLGAIAEGAISELGDEQPGEAASVSGSGSVNSTNSGQHFGTASVSGSGSATAAGFKSASGTASVSGSGEVDSLGFQHGGSASVSGSGSVTAAGRKGGRGTAAVSGSGSVTAAGAASEAIEQEWEITYPSVVEQEWVIDATFAEAIEQEWEITSDLRTAIEQEWDIESPISNTQTLESECVLISPILGVSPVIITDLPTVTIRGHVIPLESATVSVRQGQYAWTCQLSLVNPAHAALFNEDDEFTVNLPDEDYAFIVEGKSRDRSSIVNTAVQVTGVGPGVLYDSPRAQTVTRTWDEAVLATAVVEELFGEGVVQWEILDWSIPAFRLGVQDQAPMDVLKKLAAAAGATIRPDPDGTMRVQYLYPVSVPQYDSATPDQEYFDAEHNIRAGGRTKFQKLANKIRILDVDAGVARDSIEFEQDPEHFTRGTLKVFPNPWRTDITLEHTSDERVSASIVGEETEELTETVEVIGGKGSVSKPIFEVTELEWLYVDLTGVVFDTDSREFTTTHPTLTESLLRITYTTRFVKFDTAAFENAEVQYLVKEAA